MKVLITGASGFVGSHLGRLLNSKGFEVYSLTRTLHKARDFSVEGKIIVGELVDVGMPDWMDELPEDLEAVVHIAGLLHSYDDDQFDLINRKMSQNLVEQLSKKYSSLQFIFISSLAAFGPSPNPSDPADEEKQPAPLCRYGNSKLNAERVLKKVVPSTWSLTIIRPPIVIGPDDPGMLEVFQMVQKRIIPYPALQGDKNLFSFVSVFDLCFAIKTILRNKAVSNGKTYFISHPESVTFRQMIASIANSLDRKFYLLLPLPRFILWPIAYILTKIHRYIPHNFKFTTDKYREIVEKHWICSSEKSRQELEFEYVWDLDSITSTTATDYRAKRKL